MKKVFAGLLNLLFNSESKMGLPLRDPEVSEVARQIRQTREREFGFHPPSQ
ncbi:MAG: hypothetical protein JWN50_286 [Parcubacteria group bacterium]|nr:hypothetical protein [Parcubacteria group bacterium]